MSWTNSEALIEKPGRFVIGRPKGTAGIPACYAMSPCWPSCILRFYGLDLNLEKINPKFLYEYIIFRRTFR
jgi:hypothetical protein